MQEKILANTFKPATQATGRYSSQNPWHQPSTPAILEVGLTLAFISNLPKSTRKLSRCWEGSLPPLQSLHPRPKMKTWRYRKEKMLYLWKGRWNLNITLLKMKNIFPPPPFLRFQTLIFQGVPDVSRWVVGRNGSPSSDFFSKPAFRVFISSKAA